MPNEISEGELASWPRTWSVRLLAAYWITLFVATHIPRFQPTLPLRHSDKWLHGTAFGLLAVLLAIAWSQRATFGGRQALAAFAILVAYAAIDEITQNPVGRHSDVRDWQADAAGSFVGLTGFLIVRALVRRNE